MAWDDTKQNAQNPETPNSFEKLEASEWNDMVAHQKTRAGKIISTTNPATAPSEEGNLYINKTNDEIFVSKGTENVNNWVKLSTWSDLNNHATNTNNPHNTTLSQDNNPTLSANLRLNANGIIEQFTAGESLTAGQVCMLNASGQMVRAQANSEINVRGLLGIVLQNLSSGQNGNFLMYGSYTTTGLSAGSLAYLSPTTQGGLTLTRPSVQGQFIRVIGYCISSTRLFFKPDNTYVEV